MPDTSGINPDLPQNLGIASEVFVFRVFLRVLCVLRVYENWLFPMPLTIDVLTLFPRMLDGFLAESILGKGIAAGHLGVNVRDLRAWAADKHRTADDRPFGGGAGMVMKPEVAFAAIEQLQTPGCRRIYLTPDGVPLSPALALELSQQKHLILQIGRASCRERV